MNHDLFPDEFAMAASANAAEQPHFQKTMQSAALAKRTSAIVVRRANSAAMLADLLPPILEPNTSYHVISCGDVDSRSYLEHILRAHPVDTLTLSTWCMSMDDANWLFAMQDAGQLGTMHLLFGEILRSSYPDVYEHVRQMQSQERCRMTIARNHSKVMLAYNASKNASYVIESSANLNTNPRFEQTAIHTSRALLEFYKNFFDGIKSIDRENAEVSL